MFDKSLEAINQNGIFHNDNSGVTLARGAPSAIPLFIVKGSAGTQTHEVPKPMRLAALVNEHPTK